MPQPEFERIDHPQAVPRDQNHNPMLDKDVPFDHRRLIRTEIDVNDQGSAVAIRQVYSNNIDVEKVYSKRITPFNLDEVATVTMTVYPWEEV